jgi:hypothetical protein
MSPGVRRFEAVPTSDTVFLSAPAQSNAYVSRHSAREIDNGAAELITARF